MYPRLAMVALLVAMFGLFVQLSFAGDEPTPHSFIDRALKAGGGAEKIRQFKAVSFKAASKIHRKSGDESFEISAIFAGPSLFRIECQENQDKNAKHMIFLGSGDTIWLKAGKEEFFDLALVPKNSEALAETTACLYGISLADRLLTLQGKDYQLKILGNQAVKGVEAIALSVKHELHPEAIVYFAKGTGLPVKSQVKPPAPKDGEDRKTDKHVEIYYDDYKEVDGVRHFSKLRVRFDDREVECQLRDLKLHKKVAPDAFKKPG